MDSHHAERRPGVRNVKGEVERMRSDTVLQYEWLTRLRERLTLALLGNVIIIWVSFYEVSIFRVKADEASV